MKKLMIPTALAVSISLSLTGCLLPKEEVFESAPTQVPFEGAAYDTAECVKRDIIDRETLQFKYVPVNTVSLSFAVDGLNYDKFFFEAGDTVEEGQLIGQLDLGTLETDLETLNSQLASCEKQLADLNENRALDQRMLELQDAWLAYEDRAKHLDELNKRYDREKLAIEDDIYLLTLKKEHCESSIADRQIHAPFTGVLTYLKMPDVGEESDRNMKVCTLADKSLSLFRGETNRWSYIKNGTTYTIVNAKTQAEYSATAVSEESLGLPKEDKEEGKNATVYLALNDPAFDLQDGDPGRVTITIQEKYDALAVPTEAISVINGKTVVYLPDENGLRTYREVTTGVTTSTLTEITEGLQEGDTVILN